MPRQVLILVPEAHKDNWQFGPAIDYDGRTGRLDQEGGNIVTIDGEQIQVPKSWIHPVTPK